MNCLLLKIIQMCSEHYDLIYFFYLAKAVDSCTLKNKRSYLGRLKSLCKQGKIEQLLQWLQKFEEPISIENKEAPVRAVIRYINNRTGQFDYPKAIENDLPIGSGEIESAHRHLIQKRMKISGAWWKKQNVRYMLKLRSQRANSQWETYWEQKRVA